MIPAPNPGTKAASKQGCTCPVLDNCHGRGYHGQTNVFVYSEGCPLHWAAVVADSEKTGRTFTVDPEE